MNAVNRAFKNRDYLKRLNYPRQTYAFSGIDFGDSDISNRIRGKLNINDAPMIITPLPPGANASNDVLWKDTYGASMDCIMSLIDGEEYDANINASNFEFAIPYNETLPTARNNNIYQVWGGKQQIHFIVDKNTVKDARDNAAVAVLPSEARSLGIRAPIQMCGWGHTIGMRPTDPEPASPRVNDSEHYFDRSTWKIGPLDARWDDRRKVWRAFNDLIADDAGQGLGTFVFSTNPDNQCGFPFLRGKLEDVWSVRRTFREEGTTAAAKTDDVTKSALLLTKLDSYAIQSDKIASWNEVLIIFGECLDNPLPTTCGSETTSEAQMAIRVTAPFHFGPTTVGPIVFSLTEPTSDGFVKGAIYYEGEGPCGQWRPGIDICESPAIPELYQNDKNLQTAIIDLCEEVNANTSIKKLTDWIKQDVTIDETHTGFHLDHNTITQDILVEVRNGFNKIQQWSDTIIGTDFQDGTIETEILLAVNSVAVGLTQALENSINLVQDHLIGQINALAALITPVLQECCGVTIDFNAEPIDIIIAPAFGTPPDVEPTIDLDDEISRLDTLEAELIVNFGEIDGVKTDFTNLKLVIQADDGPEEPSVSVTVSDPCGDTESTASCGPQEE